VLLCRLAKRVCVREWNVLRHVYPDDRVLDDVRPGRVLPTQLPVRPTAELRTHLRRHDGTEAVRRPRIRVQSIPHGVRQLARARRYRRLAAIASGGMGTVYLGRMTDGDRVQTVAIKVLHPHLATDADMVAMFLDEARVATRLRHPNLVGVLDMDMLGDELVIVMEYVEGSTLGTLQSVLRKRGEKLPIGITLRILCDALSGLHAMHEMLDEDRQPLGLVHRDVSPHNLLVGADGATRVTDFGVALAAGRLASTRPDGTVKGKLQYLAPEQVGRKSLDRRVDIFAAGIVLWECLTGRRLFDAVTEAETVTRVLRDPIAPPSLTRTEVSTDLDEVCLRALERDPDRRFATAAAFAESLRAAVPFIGEAAEVGALVCDVAGDAIRKQRESVDRASLKPPALRPRVRGAAIVFGACLLAGVTAAGFTVRPRAASLPTPTGASVSSPLPAPPPAAPSLSEAPVLALPPAAPSRTSPEPVHPGPTAGATASGATSRDAGTRQRPHKQPSRPSRPFMPDDL
jgi:serine/threonine protein kinase